MIERIRLLLLRRVPKRIVRLTEGFWATPLVLSLLGLLLAIGVQLVPEAYVGSDWARFFGSIDHAGARNALAVVSAGMVSLVALVFSLTFVALSITSQQLSPRIADIVLHDRTAQLLLGLALATFFLCMPSLSVGGVRGSWRLGMSLLPAFVLATATIVMVVIFAHSMTRAMRAEELVARLGSELVHDVGRLLDAPFGCPVSEDDPEDFEQAFEQGAVIRVRRAGYVGVIDYPDLIALAREHSLRIRMSVRASEFLLPGVEIARLVGLHPTSDDHTQRIQDALNLSNRRETSDRASYASSALCESALRALSPGINDPATAMSCVNRIFEGLAVLVTNVPAPRLLASEDGVPRVLRRTRDARDFLESDVVPIIANARGDERVLGRIRTLAHQLDAIARRARDRAAIEKLLKRLDREA